MQLNELILRLEMCNKILFIYDNANDLNNIDYIINLLDGYTSIIHVSNNYLIGKSIIDADIINFRMMSISESADIIIIIKNNFFLITKARFHSFIESPYNLLSLIREHKLNIINGF